MNKIEKHISDKAIEYRSDYEPAGSYYQYSYLAIEWAFINGSKEIEKLELPIKFAEWKERGMTSFEIRKLDVGLYYVDDINGRSYSLKELYEYWLENIYKHE